MIYYLTTEQIVPYFSLVDRRRGPASIFRAHIGKLGLLTSLTINNGNERTKGGELLKRKKKDKVTTLPPGTSLGGAAIEGMYRVEEGAPEICLGFAHSSLGKKLVEKNVHRYRCGGARCHLPRDRAVSIHILRGTGTELCDEDRDLRRASHGPGCDSAPVRC